MFALYLFASGVALLMVASIIGFIALWRNIEGEE